MFYLSISNSLLPLADGAFGSAKYGKGNTRIHLGNVFCSGSENLLVDCSNPGIGVHDCTHSKDAGVQCSGVCVRM